MPFLRLIYHQLCRFYAPKWFWHFHSDKSRKTQLHSSISEQSELLNLLDNKNTDEKSGVSKAGLDVLRNSKQKSQLPGSSSR